MKVPSTIQPVKAKVHWRSYFFAFCEAHGGDPVPFRGRLLLPDGWMYSSTDYRGPEFPPEDGQAPFLRRCYLLIRIKLARIELKQVKTAISAVEEVQRGRSAPLKQRVRVDGKFEVRDIDTAALGLRAEWLRSDIRRSEVALCSIPSP